MPDSSAASPASTQEPPLAPWPPPGLERLRGDLWRVADRLLLGGAIFMLPLLAALTLSTDLWETGIYGDAWWILLITSVGGLWISGVGYVALVRLLRRWRTAVQRGYASRTVALVFSDRAGDTGFLIQGARAQSLIPESGRRGLLVGRLLQGGLMAFAGLWLTGGFAVGVLLAARGWMGPEGLTLWTLVPPALAGTVVVLSRGWEKRKLRQARSEWFAQGWAQTLARNDIEEWHERVARHLHAVPVPMGKPEQGGGWMRAAAAGVTLTGLFVLFLTVPIVIVSSAGSILAEITVPGFHGITERMARTEALAPWRLPLAEPVPASEAGDALYAAAGLRPGQESELLNSPPRSYEDIFPGEEERSNPTGMAANRWSRDLLPRARELEPAVVEYLEGLGRHPGLSELGLLARADALDELGALYRLPLPEDLTWLELPIPRYQRVRQLAYAQVGIAAAEVARGRVEPAEARLRELINVGHLLGTEGQYLITNQIGHVVAHTGADALAALYESTDRPDEARRLREAMSVAERSARFGSMARSRPDMASLAELATDTTVSRGMRWERVMLLLGVGPCLNLQRVVFGPPPEYRTWLDDVRSSLVRFDSEEEFLQVLEKGWNQDGTLPPVGTLFTQAMGRGAGSCTALLAGGS